MTLGSLQDDRVDILVFQNYFSPSRHAIFEKLGADCKLLVLYMQAASDEGRQWAEEEPVNYSARRIPTRQIAKMVFPAGSPGLPRKVSLAVMVDNNPTNVAMLCLAPAVRRVAETCYLWVEHIPDLSKGRGKTLYQRLTSRALLRCNDGAASFSAMSDAYLASLSYKGPINRIPQVVLPPPDDVYRPSVSKLRSFGYLGSSVARKNVDALREALHSVPRSDLCLHLAGFNVTFPAAHETCHGYVSGSSLEAFFNAIDVLVLPSIVDPWGLVVNEALMRGRLAIVSKFCGSAEIVGRIDPRFVCGLSASDIRSAVEYAAALSPKDVEARLARAADIMKQFTPQAAAASFRRL